MQENTDKPNRLLCNWLYIDRACFGYAIMSVVMDFYDLISYGMDYLEEPTPLNAKPISYFIFHMVTLAFAIFLCYGVHKRRPDILLVYFVFALLKYSASIIVALKRRVEQPNLFSVPVWAIVLALALYAAILLLIYHTRKIFLAEQSQEAAWPLHPEPVKTYNTIEAGLPPKVNPAGAQHTTIESRVPPNVKSIEAHHTRTSVEAGLPPKVNSAEAQYNTIEARVPPKVNPAESQNNTIDMGVQSRVNLVEAHHNTIEARIPPNLNLVEAQRNTIEAGVQPRVNQAVSQHNAIEAGIPSKVNPAGAQHNTIEAGVSPKLNPSEAQLNTTD